MMRQRPLSPHLQVYRLPLTAILSICHRISGFALFFSLLFFIGWLGTLCFSSDCYVWGIQHLSLLPGQLIIWLSAFAFFYHLSNGLRHMIWDCGYGFEKSTSCKSSLFVVFMAFALTLGLWSVC
ncbi:MAG: succinate dehydrogenase, cytochrome b556 subunit [Candidatus Paracaedibacteraceae bacterium]|nr:succinate dehydrogenase, cytochrome b556 subunit [Candidatus Paracaedibacteraceae bacterium]